MSSSTTPTRSGARRSKHHAFSKFGMLMATDPEAAMRISQAAADLAERLSGAEDASGIPEGMHEQALEAILTAWVEGRMTAGMPDIP
jgi:hypothetical protein